MEEHDTGRPGPAATPDGAMARLLQRSSDALSRVETVLANIGAVAMLAIMLVVVADVGMRYLFNSPLVFAYDFISMYLMVGVFFLLLAYTLHHHGHVAIDIFQHLIPARLRFLGEAVGYAAATIIFGLVAWQLSQRSARAFMEAEVTATTIPWPLWLSYLPAAIGAWAFAARCLYRSLGHLASLAAGRPLVELPPPPVTATDELERL